MLSQTQMLSTAAQVAVGVESPPSGPAATASVTVAPAVQVPAAVVVPSPGPGITDKILSPRQIAETTFWTVQLKEHCLFLYLGLEPSPVPIESVLVQMDPAAQTPLVENALLVHKLKMRAKELFMSWSAFEKMVAANTWDVAVLTNLINHTRYLKNRVLDLQQQRVWVGPLFPDFVQHMRDELDYFVQRFNDTIDPDSERLFWDEINAEHLAFTAHLLNTDYKDSRPAVAAALALSDEVMALLATLPKAPVDLQQMAQLSKQLDHLGYAQKTDALIAATIGAPNVGSVIHPVLAAHVVREGQRSIQRLTELAPAPTLTTEPAVDAAAAAGAAFPNARLAGAALLYRTLHTRLKR